MDMISVRLQVTQLTEQISKLDALKKRVRTHRSALAACWQGTEIPLMLQALDDAYTQLTARRAELVLLCQELERAALEVQAEEAAAAVAAAAAPSRRKV